MPLINDRYHLAESLFYKGQFEQAEDVLRAYLRDDCVDDGRSWELRGIVALAMGELNLAQTALETAAVLVPLSTRGQIALAACYVHSKYTAAARAILQHTATRRDIATDLLEPLASGLGAVGELELALAVCHRAVQEMPDTPAPLMGVVHYMRRLRRPAVQTLPYLESAHRMAPEDTDCRLQLAWALHESGRSADGARLLERLPLERFECIRCLTLMHTVFEAAGEFRQAELCGQRVEAVAERRRRARRES